MFLTADPISGLQSPEYTTFEPLGGVSRPLCAGFAPEASIKPARSCRLCSVHPDRGQTIQFRDDARELIAMSDVVTLPSFYREGIPRILLEAMALQKPIVTTNNVGCKEVVDDGVNGYLVPIKNASALIKAIRKVLGDDNLSRAMGRKSRQKAEREFDERVVISRVFTELYGLPSVGIDAPKAA